MLGLVLLLLILLSHNLLQIFLFSLYIVKFKKKNFIEFKGQLKTY